VQVTHRRLRPPSTCECGLSPLDRPDEDDTRIVRELAWQPFRSERGCGNV
jgi:hypothetical protein